MKNKTKTKQMRVYTSDTAIEFPDEENRIKGIGELHRNRFGFSSSGNRFFVPKEVLKEFKKKKIKYNILK